MHTTMHTNITTEQAVINYKNERLLRLTEGDYQRARVCGQKAAWLARKFQPQAIVPAHQLRDMLRVCKTG